MRDPLSLPGIAPKLPHAVRGSFRFPVFGGSVEDSSDDRGGVMMRRGSRVGVLVEREANAARMPEVGGDDVGAHAVGERELGVGMPRRMEHDPTNARTLAERDEAVEKRIRMDEAPVGLGHDPRRLLAEAAVGRSQRARRFSIIDSHFE